MKRLFVAIPIPEETALQLEVCATGLSESLKDPRFVPIQNYHITALFLGDIQESDIPQIKELITTLCNQTVPFQLQFRKISLKPNHMPKMLWAKFETHPDFTRFVATLKKLLMPFMLKLPDDYGVDPIPHITLCRFNPDPKLKKLQLPEIELENITAKNCQLVASELTPAGPVYSVISEFSYVTTN
jgi:2'-5' RNA ligase